MPANMTDALHAPLSVDCDPGVPVRVEEFIDVETIDLSRRHVARAWLCHFSSCEA
jgi:hypothetical protein